MTPTTANDVPVTRTLFDLKSFEEVTLQKEFSYSPIATLDEAKSRIGGDASKLLEIVNIGLRQMERNARVADSDPWMLPQEDGTLTAFDGVPADNKAVNALVLNLAKSLFGYNKPNASADDKRAAKDKAVSFIKNNEQIVAGLRENAALQTSAAD